MPKKQGRMVCAMEDSRRWRETAKNNGYLIKVHKSPQRQLSHPDDAICFQDGEGRQNGEERWQEQGRNGTRWGGRGVWKAEMGKASIFGSVPQKQTLRLGFV